MYLLVLLAAIAGCDRSRQGTDIPSLNESPPDTATEDLFLPNNKMDQKTIDMIRFWQYSGFSIDYSLYLSPCDTAGLERLSEYILRCPFSLARVVRLTDDGSVVYPHGFQKFSSPAGSWQSLAQVERTMPASEDPNTCRINPNTIHNSPPMSKN